jgi:hypothetical protein
MANFNVELNISDAQVIRKLRSLARDNKSELSSVKIGTEDIHLVNILELDKDYLEGRNDDEIIKACAELKDIMLHSSEPIFSIIVPPTIEPPTIEFIRSHEKFDEFMKGINEAEAKAELEPVKISVRANIKTSDDNYISGKTTGYLVEYVKHTDYYSLSLPSKMNKEHKNILNYYKNFFEYIQFQNRGLTEDQLNTLRPCVINILKLIFKADTFSYIIEKRSDGSFIGRIRRQTTAYSYTDIGGKVNEGEEYKEAILR